MRKYGNLFVKFFSIQSIISIAGILAGLGAIHLMSKHNYAVFTMITVYSSSLIMLTDSGISSGLNALLGRYWEDQTKLVKLINSAIRLRRRIFWMIVPVVSVVLVFNFWRLDIPWYVVACVWLIILLEFQIRISFSFTKVVLQIFKKYQWLQYSDLIAVVFRITGLGVLWLLMRQFQLDWSSAIILYAFVLLGFYWQMHVLKKKRIEITGTDKEYDATYEIELHGYFKRQIPNTLFFSIHSQIMLWILSLIGSTDSIAEIGALGRIAIIFSMVLGFFQNVILPEFSRTQDVASLKKQYVKMIAAYIGMALIVFTASYVFRSQLLWLLGKKYSDAGSLLPLMVLNTLANTFAGFLYSINVSKGWMHKAYLIIVFEIISWVILYFLLDLKRVDEVIWFGIISVLAGTSANFIMTYNGLKHYHKQFSKTDS
jgi:O-antigen/teichoic acid export membrane protein